MFSASYYCSSSSEQSQVVKEEQMPAVGSESSECHPAMIKSIEASPWQQSTVKRDSAAR